MTEPGTSGVSGLYRGVRKGAPLLLLGVVAALPHVYSEAYFIRLLFVTLVWLTTSVAWNILGGFAGQVSFGFAVFYGLGAYTTALLLNSGMNRASCLLLGACVAAVASLLIGLPTFRLKGPYFAIATLGVNPFRTKLLAHALGAALTGMAGGVYAGYAAFIYPGGVFAFDISVHILLMPIIGGVGTVWGPVFGSVVNGAVHEELVASFPQLHLLLYGSLLILIILFEPGGVLGLLGKASRVLARARSAGGSHS